MYEPHPVLRQLYVVGAVLAFAASFVPLYEPQEPGDIYQTMSVWTAVPDYGSGTAVLAILLVLVLCLASLYAAHPGLRGRGAPITILVLAVIGALMLLTKAGEGSHPPSFGAGAGLLFGASLALLLTAVLDLGTSLKAGPWVDDPTGPPVPRIRWNP